jgi:hypothetical protein
MLARASKKGLIRVLMRNFRPDGILTLQYADDTLLFASSEDDCIKNLKIVLMLFEKVLGMRINFHKSELIPLNLDPARAHEIPHMFSCPLEGLPFKYLGVPIHFERLKREDLQPVLYKMIRRIASWGGGKLLAYSSRLILIKTCLASVPVYLLSFFKFPK